MNKRLLKRHKRQVARAKENAKLSEPDVRTPEQIKAAREASRPTGGFTGGPHANYSAPIAQNRGRPAADSASKTDA